MKGSVWNIITTMRLKLISSNLPTSLGKEIWSDVLGMLTVWGEAWANAGTQEKGPKPEREFMKVGDFIIECTKAGEDLDQRQV